MNKNYLTLSRRKWRDRNYFVEKCEYIMRLPGGVTRRSDLFGFADLLCIPTPDAERDEWVYLQVTSRSNISTRLRKIQNQETGKGQWARPISLLARAVLERGDRVVIEGWDQPNGPGTRWRDKEREVTLEDLDG